VQTGRDFWSAALAKISEPWLTLALASGLGVTFAGAAAEREKVVEKSVLCVR